MKISKIHSRQILDSRGNPTVETDVILEDGSMGRAAVPSGASTGQKEELELRDKNGEVLTAVDNVNTELAAVLTGFDATDQFGLDEKMNEADGTENKSHLGANAILSVSMAAAKAASSYFKIPLYEYFGNLIDNDKFLLPLPLINIINGGKHANWCTDIQEYMILPVGANSFHHALEMSAEVFHHLADVLKKYGYDVTVGDEGGYAPHVKNGNHEPFDLISQAIEVAGFKVGNDFVFGMDVAASELFKNEKYHIENADLNSDKMINFLNKFPVVSIEDGLDQNDWENWTKLTANSQKQIVGDDLFATNTKYIERGIQEKSANAVIIKVNQVGTISETIEAVRIAKKAGWNAIISHRSGETEDTTIADLAVGLGTGQIKAGSVSRTDRVVKYNQLLRIEEQLGNKAIYHNKLWLN